MNGIIGRYRKPGSPLTRAFGQNRHPVVAGREYIALHETATKQLYAVCLHGRE